VIHFTWDNKFNARIDFWALVEIGLVGRSFTWRKNQRNLMMSRLDRIFCTTNFEALLPLGNARAISRLGTDHTPFFGTKGSL
jgi:hypothetical protein